MKLKLFHITLEAKKIDKFYPRVPATIRDDENNTEVRLCLADSIENCLNLVAWAENEKIEDIFYDCDEKSLPIKVYEFEINENDVNLVHPKDVYKKGVIDAKVFNEYWYIGEKPLIPLNVYDIRIDSSYNQDGVSIYAYESEDKEFTQDDFDKLSNEEDFDEEEFFDLFYSVERLKNTDFNIYPCTVINPEYCDYDSQIVRLKFKDTELDSDVIKDIISDVVDSILTPLHEETLDIEFDINEVSDKVFDVEINSIFFSFDQDELVKLFGQEGLKLAV